MDQKCTTEGYKNITFATRCRITARAGGGSCIQPCISAPHSGIEDVPNCPFIVLNLCKTESGLGAGGLGVLPKHPRIEIT